jgi:hypothetical protein
LRKWAADAAIFHHRAERTREASKQGESAQSIAGKVIEKLPTVATSATRLSNRIDFSAAA